MKLLQLIAVIVSTLVATLPLAGATQVNILFNGVVQQTASISPQNLVNKQISIIHDPADITWSQVRVLVTVNSASLAHSIERIFLFKCQLLDPVACSNVAPIDFETFADTELLWNDISQQEGGGTYPQTGHLMTLVKLKGIEGETIWVGFFDKIIRTDFNIFTKFNFELDEIDFHANSFDFVTPAASFIENFQMLPFTWAEKVEFNAAPLFAVGGDETELDIPILSAANPSGDTVTAINKEFFLVSAQTASGITNFIPLNQNPSFTCGDGVCDIPLGESSSTCCFDCGCSSGSYCDLPGDDPEAGVCKAQGDISLSVIPPSIPEVTDCSQPVAFDLSFQINNPPASLPSTLSSIVTLNGTPHAVTCSGGPLYTCPLQIQSPVACGAGSFTIGPNAIEVTLTFNDGSNQISLPLSSEVPDLTFSLNCGCPEGFFCDSSLLVCKSEGSISLSVLNVTSFLPNFNPAGDSISLTAQINNPPSDLAVTGFTFILGTLFKDSTPIQNATSGSITCSQGSSHVYTCEIPLSISGYDHTFAYFFKGNSITFTVSFSNVDTTVVKDLTSAFSDISIPGFQCGDGVCNVEESQSNCCLDCGCQQSGMFCDVNVLSCDFLNNIGLEILSAFPTQLEDCQPQTPHTIDITAQVTNPPSDLSLDFVFYLEGGVVQAFPLTCSLVNPGANAGLFSCQLTLPALEECQQQPNDFVLGPNALNFTISFSNGNQGIIGKTLQASFDDIVITPIFKIGDGICESILGESAANSCIDCPCEDDPAFGGDFFCDIPQPFEPGDAGECVNKNDIKLIIDSPTQIVTFDSCETPQKVLIKAHIQNEPSNVIGTAFSAVLDGENADLFSCKKTGFGFIGENASAPIECSLRVPSDPTCSKGKTTTFSPNSVSATIAFVSGISSTRVATITAPLPPIRITQQIKSIFDITQEAFEDMQRQIDETEELVDELLDKLETCLDVALLLAIVSMAAVIAGGVGGGLSGNWQQGVQGGIGVGTGLMQMWSAYCNLINAHFQAQIHGKQLKIQFRQSQLCVDFVQHSIDLGPDGPCFGQELSCFNQLVSCLDFSSINSALNLISSSISQANQATQQFGAGLQQFGAGIQNFGFGFGGGGNAVLTVLYNNGPLLQGNNACNRMSGVQNQFLAQSCGGTGNRDTLTVKVISGFGCQFPVVLANGQLLCGGSQECSNKNIDIDTYGSTTTFTFTLYCFSDQQNYVSQSNNLDINGGNYKKSGDLKVTVLADPQGCDCGLGGQQEEDQQQQPEPVTLNPPQETINPGETVTFTAKIDPNLPNTAPFVYKFDWENDGPFETEDESNSKTFIITSPPFDSSRTVRVVAFDKNPSTGQLTLIGSDTSQVTVTTADEEEGGGPTVQMTTPLDNAVDVDPATNVILTFSAPMNTQTVSWNFNPTMTYTFGWSGVSTVLNINPFGVTDENLDSNTLYTVMVSGQDEEGNPLTGQTEFTFRTV